MSDRRSRRALATSARPKRRLKAPELDSLKGNDAAAGGKQPGAAAGGLTDNRIRSAKATTCRCSGTKIAGGRESEGAYAHEARRTYRTVGKALMSLI